MSCWKGGEVDEVAVLFVPLLRLPLAGDVRLGASSRAFFPCVGSLPNGLLLLDRGEAGAVVRARMDCLGEIDLTSQDVLVEAVRDLEKQLWMLRVSLPA
jgi:hypothetical protein